MLLFSDGLHSTLPGLVPYAVFNGLHSTLPGLVPSAVFNGLHSTLPGLVPYDVFRVRVRVRRALHGALLVH